MHAKQQQSGFALLIFVIMLIGMGAFIVSDYLNEVKGEIKSNKYQKNLKILNEAKQALLMYVYNYPLYRPDRGPGRLPCPDTDNNGVPDPSFNCIVSTVPMVGRFPYKAPGIDSHELKDADGETLWYAVSRNFANQISPSTSDFINSDTLGSITLVDQAGSIIYDGTTEGIAAVIIAPGPPISRDEDNDIAGVYEYSQIRTTTAEKNNPRNYLDTISIGGVLHDNASFINNNVDGFIIGPVKDSRNNTYVVNDQIVIITAEEVIQKAEAAVLQTYRNAINVYLSNTGGVYPWLYDYTASDLTTYNSGTLSGIGRIPAFFTEYFADVDSVPFDSELRLSFVKSFKLNGDVFGTTYNLSYNNVTPVSLPNMRFDIDGDASDGVGRLRADTLPLYIEDKIKYFYDDLVSPTGWKACLDDGDGIPELTDCNRNAAGAPDPTSGVNGRDSKILKVGVQVDYDSEVRFDIDYDSPVNTEYFAASASPSTHAEILHHISADKISRLPVTVYFEEAEYDTALVYTVVDSDSQDLNDDSDMTDVINQTTSVIKIGIRYYPVLPDWARTSKNDWHNSIMMAVSPGYIPGSGMTCNTATCLSVSDIGGKNNNKIALLVMAGSSNIVDGNISPAVPADGDLTNDLGDIFETENLNFDNIFVHNEADDKILVLQAQ